MDLDDLPGELIMWILIVSELLVFAAGVTAMMAMQVTDPQGFSAARAMLDGRMAALTGDREQGTGGPADRPRHGHGPAGALAGLAAAAGLLILAWIKARAILGGFLRLRAAPGWLSVLTVPLALWMVGLWGLAAIAFR